MKRPLLVLLFLAMLPFVPRLALAQDAVARATFVSGDAKARGSDGAIRALIRGGELHAGDTVVTGAGASVQLTFADNSRVAVRASTEFAIDEFQMGGNEGFILRLTRGALRSITGLIGHRNKQNFSLRTPVATIGIRGTDFEAVHVPEGGNAFGAAVSPGTYNKVYSGGTELVSKAGKIDLNINEVGFIGIGGGGAGPVKIDQLPAGIIKVINAAPIVSKVETAPSGSDATGGDKAATAGTDTAGGGTTSTETKSTTLDATTLKTLDTTAIKTTTLPAATTTTLDSSAIKTTTLSPTTTSTLSTTTLSPTTTSTLSTTTLSPTTTSTLSTTTLSPTTTSTLSTTTLSPAATSTLSTTTVSPTTTTTINSSTLQNSTLQLNTSTQLTK